MCYQKVPEGLQNRDLGQSSVQRKAVGLHQASGYQLSKAADLGPFHSATSGIVKDRENRKKVVLKLHLITSC